MEYYTLKMPWLKRLKHWWRKRKLGSYERGKYEHELQRAEFSLERQKRATAAEFARWPPIKSRDRKTERSELDLEFDKAMVRIVRESILTSRKMVLAVAQNEDTARHHRALQAKPGEWIPVRDIDKFWERYRDDQLEG